MVEELAEKTSYSYLSLISYQANIHTTIEDVTSSVFLSMGILTKERWTENNRQWSVIQDLGVVQVWNARYSE